MYEGFAKGAALYDSGPLLCLARVYKCVDGIGCSLTQILYYQREHLHTPIYVNLFYLLCKEVLAWYYLESDGERSSTVFLHNGTVRVE